MAIINQFNPSIAVEAKAVSGGDGMATFMAGLVLGLAIGLAFDEAQERKDRHHG